MIIFNQARIIFHNFKVIKVIEPKLRKTTQLPQLCNLLITSECSYAYMCVSPPITMKSPESQSSSHFTTFPKEFHFQSKASQFSMKSNETIFSNHINSIHP